MKNIDKKIIYAICLFAIIVICGYLISHVSMMETVEHSGIITMKWESPKILTTHYYFEIDNTTQLNINSYDYHKYNIGDTYIWETKE